MATEFARNFGPLILHEMERVEISGIKGGVNKKQAVLDGIRALVDASDLDSDVKSHIGFLLAYVVPNMIDIIISASKGGVALNFKHWCC